MTIEDLQREAHTIAKLKGWHGEGRPTTQSIIEKLALIHSEVSEMVEEARITSPGELTEVRQDETGKPVGFMIEAADVAIRLGDLCGLIGGNLSAAVDAKMRYNATRSHRHGGKLA